MNAEIKIIEIESVEDLLIQIEYLKSDFKFEKLWFRGVADESYGLEPSIFRHTDNAIIEKQLHNRFSIRALPFLKTEQNANSYWDRLFIMQHYGLPTRLLDWSESALISLAFSVIYREEKHNGKDAAIWCLDPIKLNRDFVKSLNPAEPIPNITDKTVRRIQIYEDAEIPVDFPIAVYGPLNNERIVAQKGVFTLFPFKEKFKLEDLPNVEVFLMKLLIKSDKVDFIKNQLITMGITENNVYPGLESIAKEIKREILNA
jgi:hypothetical protein